MPACLPACVLCSTTGAAAAAAATAAHLPALPDSAVMSQYVIGRIDGERWRVMDGAGTFILNHQGPIPDAPVFEVSAPGLSATSRLLAALVP